MAVHKYICRDGDMIDLVCFQHYGRSDGGVMNAVFQYPENRGLRDAGQRLNAGDIVFLPDQPVESEQDIVRLWDEVDE